MNRPKNQTAPSDRLPPHSIEAEAGVLGCILLDPVRCLSDCAEVGMLPEWFYDLRHQLIFQAMISLDQSAKGVDVLLVRNQLKGSGDLEKVGGDDYLAGLPDCVPSSANLPHYIEIVETRYLSRCLVRSCVEALAGAYNEAEPVDHILERAEQQLAMLSEKRTGANERALKPLLHEVIDGLERGYHRGSAQIEGVTTGIEYVDKMLCGFGGENGNMIVVAGRPGTGKTSWAIDVALHASLDYVWVTPKLDANGQAVLQEGKPEWIEHKGIPVGIFSMEMSANAIVKKMLFQRARADLQRWRTGFARADDFPKLTTASAQIVKAPVWIDDAGRCSIGELRSKARRWVRQYGIRLFIIDYIQLMRADNRRFRDDRVQELAEISGEIQNLGKTLQVPFLVLAQMNRDYEKEPGRMPRLSDLKDCGAIEQDADIVAFLYSPVLTKDPLAKHEEAMERIYGQDWSGKARRVDLLVAKNRFGPTGVCKQLFEHHCTRFVDYVRTLKGHGLKDPAAGERKPMIDPEDLPL